MLVDLTLRHWMLLLTTWLLLRISETVRKIVKALEPPVSAAALLGLRSSRKKSAAPTYKAGFSLPRVARSTTVAFGNTFRSVAIEALALRRCRFLKCTPKLQKRKIGVKPLIRKRVSPKSGVITWRKYFLNTTAKGCTTLT